MRTQIIALAIVVGLAAATPATAAEEQRWTCCHGSECSPDQGDITLTADRARGTGTVTILDADGKHQTTDAEYYLFGPLMRQRAWTWPSGNPENQIVMYGQPPTERVALNIDGKRIPSGWTKCAQR